VQPVAPVIIGNGRQVDAFCIHFFSAKLGIHAEQIRQLENAPHCWRRKMLPHWSLNDFRRSFAKSLARLTKFAVEKFLRECAILCPPAANGAHVVRAGRHHAQIRCVRQPRKLLTGIFRHSLDFEAQQAEIAHHPGQRFFHGNRARQRREICITNLHFHRRCAQSLCLSRADISAACSFRHAQNLPVVRSRSTPSRSHVLIGEFVKRGIHADGPDFSCAKPPMIDIQPRPGRIAARPWPKQTQYP